MKKFARTLLLFTVLLSITISSAAFAIEDINAEQSTGVAENSAAAEEDINASTSEAVIAEEATSDEPLFDAVSVCLSSMFIPTATEGEIVFSLYDETKTNLLDTKSFFRHKGNCWTRIEFSVPKYEIGTKFTLCLENGAKALTFCDVTGNEHILQTYSYPNEEGHLDYQTEFYMELHPFWSKKAEITIPGIRQTEFFHYIIEDEVYVTEDLLSLLGINVTKAFEEEKPYFTLSAGDGHTAVFYNDDIYATFGGTGENLPYKAFVTDNMPFVPLSRVAEYFDCGYSVISDDIYQKKINLSLSKYSDAYKEAVFVNEKGYESDTDYLVWVSKKDYTVKVYLGGKGSWRLIKSAKCAIGAPSTPTIEGVFKYHQYQTRWQYDGYYCGPIMRFYKGYALHSTLIRNNGTPYDNRVGVRISHGCVRLRPDDINWLVAYVPLGSTVAVTA